MYTDGIAVTIGIIGRNQIRVQLKSVLRADINMLPRGMTGHPAAPVSIFTAEYFHIFTLFVLFGHKNFLIKIICSSDQSSCPDTRTGKHHKTGSFPDLSAQAVFLLSFCALFFGALIFTFTHFFLQVEAVDLHHG